MCEVRWCIKSASVLHIPAWFVDSTDEIQHWLLFGDLFTGILTCAYDIVLSAPGATALCKMLPMCDKYASDLACRLMPLNLSVSFCSVHHNSILLHR